MILRGGERNRNYPQRAQIPPSRYQERAGQAINSFLFLQVGGPSSKWEAVGMFSGDGEYIDFIHSVLLEGPVEVSFYFFFSIRKFAWLCEERTFL